MPLVTKTEHDSAAVPPPSPDPGLLALRLEQLRDGEWSRRFVTGALEQLFATTVQLQSFRVAYCKVKPQRDINVAVEVEWRRAPGETSRRQWLSFTFFPALGKARRKVDEELARRPAARQRTPAAILLPDAAAIARAFPNDPVLHALEHAVDAVGVAMLAARASGGDAEAPATAALQVLHYKPGRSCTLHYDAQWVAPTTPTHRQFYGKIYRDDRGANCYELLRRAWDAASHSGQRWFAARPVAYLPDWRFVLQEAVPGRQFRHVFAEQTHDTAGPAELEHVADQLRAVASAIAAMQQSKPPSGPVCDFEYLLAAQQKNLAYLAGCHAELAQEIAEIRAELKRLARRTAPAPMVFAHGDFAHGNVLVGELGVGIIDFDRAGLAEAPYDVAYFLTHLWSFGIRHPRRHANVAKLCDQFRDAYLAQVPSVTRERLALYEALDFTAYVLRNFRKQSHQSNWFDWALAQVRAARCRLIDASGGTEVRQ